jgi:hypothetical protein
MTGVDEICFVTFDVFFWLRFPLGERMFAFDSFDPRFAFLGFYICDSLGSGKVSAMYPGRCPDLKSSEKVRRFPGTALRY